MSEIGKETKKLVKMRHNDMLISLHSQFSALNVSV